MELVRVSASSPDPGMIGRALGVLRTGALLIYPTDTLYALGGLALRAGVATRVRSLKGRDGEKALPTIAADADQARSLCRAWPPVATLAAHAFWPGPLTLVLTAAEQVPREVTTSGGTVAVRVPASTVARALCADGPLISTSANPSGEPAPIDCAAAVRGVGSGVALALDSGVGQPVSSTIVDLTGDRPYLIRPGPISWEAIREVLREGGAHV